jgi:hypothetical protein
VLDCEDHSKPYSFVVNRNVLLSTAKPGRSIGHCVIDPVSAHIRHSLMLELPTIYNLSQAG